MNRMQILLTTRVSVIVTQDLQQFNDFFIEKEEECIIRTQALEEQLAKAQPGANVSKLRSAFVDLHGVHLTQTGCKCLP